MPAAFSLHVSVMARGCVFAKSDILTVLKLLDREYRKASEGKKRKDGRMLMVYSKMAVVALGGWIEDGMISLKQISANGLSANKRKKLEESTRYIFGFGYDKHISAVMMYAFGVHGLEYIEAQVGESDVIRLSSSLGKLAKWRNDAAHSHTKTVPCNPEMIIKEFEIIFPIVKKMEEGARMYRNDHFRR